MLTSVRSDGTLLTVQLLFILHSSSNVMSKWVVSTLECLMEFVLTTNMYCTFALFKQTILLNFTLDIGCLRNRHLIILDSCYIGTVL